MHVNEHMHAHAHVCHTHFCLALTGSIKLSWSNARRTLCPGSWPPLGSHMLLHIYTCSPYRAARCVWVWTNTDDYSNKFRLLLGVAMLSKSADFLGPNRVLDGLRLRKQKPRGQKGTHELLPWASCPLPLPDVSTWVQGTALQRAWPRAIFGTCQGPSFPIGKAERH